MRRYFLFLVLLCTLIVLLLLCNQNSTGRRKFYLLSEIPTVSSDLEFPHRIKNPPDVYFENNSVWFRYNGTCARYPQVLDVKFTNDYWQTQEVTNGTFQLFNAYLDDRGVGKNWSVRIVGMGRINPKQRFHCQIWSKDSSEIFITDNVDILRIWLEEWVGYEDVNVYQPYLITCPLPKDKIPGSVSVVENPCDNATNNLRISYKTTPQKKNFVVCVKGLSFPYEDKSVRLLEWIELVRTLGAEKITFYKFGVHPRMQKVLDYYSQKGGVEVVPISLLGVNSNHPSIQQIFLRDRGIERRLQEVVTYNDCLYKHLQEFEYVVLLDIDEIILPTKIRTWVPLIRRLRKSGKDSYLARNVYFFEELDDHPLFEGIPTYMYMLQHVFRAKDYAPLGFFVKGFHDVRRVLTLHNHYPLNCLRSTGACFSLNADAELMQLQHYRKGCADDLPYYKCDALKANTVKDLKIWRYKEQLIRNVQKVLVQLNFSNSKA